MSLNLSSIIFQSAKIHPHQPAFATGQTYTEVAKNVRLMGEYFMRQGIQPGDRVGIMSENRPEFTIAYFAILSIGAVVVPISILLAKREIIFCLENSGAVALISSEGVLEKAKGAQARFGDGLRLFCLEDLVMEIGGKDALLADFPYPTAPDDTAVIFYTSGTTGVPKGAEVTHFNLFANAQWVSERSLQASHGITKHWGRGHCTLAVLALTHSFGQTCMQNAPLMNGGCIAYAARFDPKKIVAQMADENVTILAAVPRMIKEILDLPAKDIPELESFQYCLVGGAPIDQSVATSFEDKFGVKVLEGYGLSETSPVVAFRTPQVPRKQGSVGRAISGLDLKVVDGNGNGLGSGDVGELLIRGHAVMKGYYQNQEETNKSIQDGWFYTGDLAYLDDDGNLYIVDRKKDLIIRNGYNVYPAEVENVLCAFPGVEECAVIGVKDPVHGEEVKAFVVGQCDLKDLVAHCKENLAAYKYPRKVEFVPELPKGTKGQILRRKLKEVGKK